MQNTKDSFYFALKSRLVALNPARTIVVRGVVRPGIVVKENELATALVPVNVFCLDWSALQVLYEGPLPMSTLECSIKYATDGDVGNGGMDRGRLLSAMDAELSSALGSAPHRSPKINYASASTVTSPVAMGTNLFWSNPTFGAASALGERLQRTVTVQVYGYQEAGEL